MRFWLKLLLLVSVAALAQLEIQWNEGWLDDQLFAVRVGLHNLAPGADPCDEELMQAARDLWRRDEERIIRRSVAAFSGGR